MTFDFRVVGLAARPEKLPIDVLLSLMQRARHISPTYSEFGEGLLPGGAQYLSGHSLRALIRDELPPDVAKAEIKENKKLYQRMTVLLPALADFFSPKRRDNILGFTMMVADCSEGYRASLHSGRKDRKEREALNAIAQASASLKNAIKAVGVAQRFATIAYEEYHELLFDPDTAKLAHIDRLKKHSNTKERRTIEVLTREMDVCRAAFDIALASARQNPDELLLAGSNSKTTVVSYAHDMSLMWSGPKISTTPGSNFSVLCSLLFECVSGKADESLAGAINRYARSRQRLKLDEEEREYQEEQALSDNFDDLKNTIERGYEVVAECECLLALPDLGLVLN